jgi:hypothetical protein
MNKPEVVETFQEKTLRVIVETKASNKTLDNIEKDVMEIDMSNASPLCFHLRRLVRMMIDVAKARGETIQDLACELIVRENTTEAPDERVSEQETV